MNSLQKFLPKYSLALALIFIATVYFLMTKGNTLDIEMTEVTTSELVQAVYATGFVEADAVAALNAECSGRVTAVGALEGQHVTAGQKIIQFDSPQTQLAVHEAKSALAEQQALLRDSKLRTDRKRNLFNEGAISRQELEDAEKSTLQTEELLQQRQFQVKMREEDLKKLAVTAPFSGILTLQSVKKGDYVTLNTLVARVVDPSRFMISVEVDELDIPKMRKGQKATVAFDAYPEQRLSAVVTRIVPQTDRITKSSRIYLTLGHLPGNIQTGMTATANIIYNVRPNALLVRKHSLLEENHQSYVWKIDHGILKKQLLQLGKNDVTFVEVLQGLKKGEKIALSPDKSWHEGVDVHIIPTKKE
ncbi:MAG: efflux RND transporter periplasmic adaptor subunit [Chlorobium sp.]